jgi:hypothetical protein
MQLANARALASSEARDLRPDVLKILYDGYRNGFLHLA